MYTSLAERTEQLIQGQRVKRYVELILSERIQELQNEEVYPPPVDFSIERFSDLLPIADPFKRFLI